ncbi:MAG: FAD-linked oxidase C-terminal domain-containing protein [Saprospiraceae bacterium]|nr:FAD-binding protein [Lewinella sp.]
MPNTNTLNALREMFGERLQTTEEILSLHSRDISWHPPSLPEAVCYPESTDEVAEILRLCHTNRTPVVPFGAGTSLEGHIIPYAGGITIDLSRMSAIKAIHPIDRDCVVQAGVRKLQLNKALQPHELFFAAGPGIDASLGGIAASGASGANAVRYGTAKENIRALEVVTAEGKIVKTGSRVKKTSAGYDLTHLMVGSEGTLGIITEVTAILHPLPGYSAVAVVSFPTVQEAMEAAVAMIRQGLPLAMLEFMDEVVMRVINNYAGTDYAEQPTLFLEIHTDEALADIYRHRLSKIITEQHGSDFQWGSSPDEKARLWEVRYNVAHAILAIRPGGNTMSTDVCVPISRLAECILQSKAELAKINHVTPLFGHVGDGNFHISPNILVKNEEEIRLFQRINEELINRILKMEGTCTGEHGIGIGKKKYLEQELGQPAIDMMRAIKKALDPYHILNPGKIFDFY